MKTQMISIVSQTSKMEYGVYIAVGLIVFVLYVMCDLYMQNVCRMLEKDRHDMEEEILRLHGEILLADKQIDELSSYERIRPMAENIGLSFNEAANKVQLFGGLK